MPDSILKTCTPRQDVLDGATDVSEFAAKLEQVVFDPDSNKNYGDADHFFALTYPTEGMKGLFSGVLGRLSGQKIPGSEKPVVLSQTSFGGGKTHGLIGLYHLARGARPGKEFFLPGFDESKIPDGIRLAAVVGESLDPSNGLIVNGHHTKTLWGAVCASLGDDVWEATKKSDEDGNPPSTETLRAALKGSKAVVVIDELAHHLRIIGESNSESVRRLSKQVPAFFKNLFHLAASGTDLVVVISLAGDTDAYAKETQSAQQFLTDALAEVGSVTSRQAAVVVPAEDTEIAAILRRRLFESTGDDSVAKAVAAEHRALYEALAEQGNPMPGEATKGAEYEEAMVRTYPFHPELIRVLDKRLSTIPNFQRTRGALRLLAMSLHRTWKNGETVSPVLNVADVELAHDDVLEELTSKLDRPKFKQVAQADVSGADSHAVDVDDHRGATQPFAVRAATTTFLHSLAQVAGAGAATNEVLLGSLRPGEQPEQYSESLEALTGSAWYLNTDGIRWTFRVEPNVNKIIQDEATNLPKPYVNQEVTAKVGQAFASSNGITLVHDPDSYAGVEDLQSLQMVVFDHQDSAVYPDKTDPLPAPSKVVEIATKAGQAGGPRRNRNGLVFLCPDGDEIEPLTAAVKRFLAAEAIIDSDDRQAELGPDVIKKVQKMKEEYVLEVRVAISKAYSHLYYPSNAKVTDNLGHVALSPADKGTVKPKQTEVILAQLRDVAKVKDAGAGPLAWNVIQQKVMGTQQRITTADVLAHFWFDPSLEIPVDTLRLAEAIKNGIKNDGWVYYDALAQKSYTSTDAPPAVQFDADRYLYTQVEAEKDGILAKTLSAADIIAVLKDAGGSLEGDGLYDSLEDRLGKRPQKKDLLPFLTRIADGPTSDVVLVVGPMNSDAVQMTPAQIEKEPHAKVVFATRQAAAAAGVKGQTAKKKTVHELSFNGAPAAAFTNLSDAVAEFGQPEGISRLTLGVSLGAGAGLSDAQSLLDLQPLAPKWDATLAMDVQATVAGGEVNVLLEDVAIDNTVRQQLGDIFKVLKHATGIICTRYDITFHPKDGEPVLPTDAAFTPLANNAPTFVQGHVTLNAEVRTK